MSLLDPIASSGASSSSPRWTRRDLLRQSSLLTAAAATAPLASATTTAAPPSVCLPAGPTAANLYTQIGVRPLINARGTYTLISGSQSLPQVKQAMYDASQYYVALDELMPAVGAEIARLMGAPDALVTVGCEAAIALATAACICGTDPERSQSFPYYKARGQVIIPRYSRNPYDFGIRMSGPKIIEVETDEELRAAICSQTAMIYILSGPRAFEEPLSIKTICAIARQQNVPVFVDAAAEEPIVPNIHLAAGATFVGYSGGKCMRGPQTAGVLLGPKDLCAAAYWNAAPHHNWGRALKVGKEEAMGMLAAVRQWYQRDHAAEQREWLMWINTIAEALHGVPSLTTTVDMPTADLSNRAPVLSIHWDAVQAGITGSELVERLDQGTPRILVMGGTGKRPDHMQSSIAIMPYMLQPGEYKTVAATIANYFHHPGQHHDPAKPTGTFASLNGTWHATVTYTRGTGHQLLLLTQQGAAVTGTLEGELFSAPVHGSVEGSQATLISTLAGNGNPVPYTFTGIVSGNSFSGSVDLGEYGTGAFQATRT